MASRAGRSVVAGSTALTAQVVPMVAPPNARTVPPTGRAGGVVRAGTRTRGMALKSNPSPLMGEGQGWG